MKKYRYFVKFNGQVTEESGDDLRIAHNSSYWAGQPYFIRQDDGTEKAVIPDYVMTDNLIDGGFHNSIIRKNKSVK